MHIHPPAEALDRAHALPAHFYVDSAMADIEHDCVFARSWQLVAHAGQLAESGDHVVEAIGKMPVLIVRGHDGMLRAFANVCRHRHCPPQSGRRGHRQAPCPHLRASHGIR